MSTSLRCSRCGTVVVATSKKVLDGQTLCPSCYRKAIEEVKLAEQELEELLEYARELFGITEIPPDWLEQIKAYKKVNAVARFQQLDATIKASDVKMINAQNSHQACVEDLYPEICK